MTLNEELEAAINAPDPGTTSFGHLSPRVIGSIQGVRLIPGMPAEAFIATGERTALSYFLKPLLDQVSRAFREE